MAWCGIFYIRNPREKFLAKEDVENSSDLVVDNKTIYHWRRPRDHLMTHFQYSVCHFRNVKGRDPIPNMLEDDRLLWDTQKKTLYAFWIRRPEPVKNNLITLKRIH